MENLYVLAPNALVKYWNLWTVTRFWWLWGTAAPIAIFVLCAFVSLVVRGVVTSDNILPWSGILLVLAAVMGGSIWLRQTDHPNLAAIPLLLFLVPVVVSVGGALLFSAFYFLVFLFGHGRMN